MHRTALILLMVLLPLQSIWAAAVNACPHERVSAGKPAADHALEPAHEHTGNADRADDGSTGTNGHPGSSADSTCHGQGNAAVFAEGPAAVAVSGAGIVPSPYIRFVAERYLESPLRPPVLQLA